ncbi:hypothetical protein JHK86_006746 [Glycine max]|nr:hypothetical protein JHK86_006746 [Glycine max]
MEHRICGGLSSDARLHHQGEPQHADLLVDLRLRATVPHPYGLRVAEYHRRNDAPNNSDEDNVGTSESSSSFGFWFVREVMLHVLKAYSCQFEIEPQVAERQGKYLAILLNKIGKANGGRANSAKDVDFGDQFVYKHMGSMASIGSYKALVDLR